MKLLTLLSPALFAAIAHAATADPLDASEGVESATESFSETVTDTYSGTASTRTSSSSSSSSPTPEPTPLGEIWAPKWSPEKLAPEWTEHCRSRSTIPAEIYKLGQIYPALKTWAPELKVFYNKKHYEGSWGGVDEHGNDRELVKMDLEDVPFAMREWLQRNHGIQKSFSVQDDVVFFAPGALYPLLPLWVEESSEGGELGGDCEGVFEDLENYSTTPRDGAVIARVAERKREGKHGLEFTVEALQVKKAEQKRDEL